MTTMSERSNTVPGKTHSLPDQRDGFAAGPVAAIVVVVAVVLLLRSGRYQYFGDELYFLAAGRHLGLGYADQGPLLPLLAHCAAVVTPGSVVALRLASIAAAAAGVALSAATAHEYGGARRAQTLAALAYATCPYLITQAASLSTFSLDSTLSATVVWALVRWTRTRRDRLLLAAAAAIALDTQVKLLIVVLLAGIAIGVAAAGPRELLRRPSLWAGVILIALAAAPGIWWQYRHHWPQLAMGAVIRAEQRAATGGAVGLPVQWALLTGLLGGLLATLGCWVLLWRKSFRDYRFVGCAALTQIAFVVATGGRPYYVAAYFPAVFAAGAVALPAMRHGLPRIVKVAVAAVSAAVAVIVVTALPLPATRLHHPVRSQAELSTRMRLFGTSGWSRLTDVVGGAAHAHATDPGHTVIITQTYWQASALTILGPRDLPPVYSPDRGFAYFGMPPDTTHTVLYVTAGQATPTEFTACEPVSHLDDPLGFPGIDNAVTVWRCEPPRQSWPSLWSRMTTLRLDPGIRTDRVIEGHPQ
ncbi:glycosyltransferase family 39 protein [Nocardia alni]|uniref:glycosyltransferase family 39 protein n=1 Tax=Nocardia alni TaxID=2815723 RepID=UPI001C23EF46|nr:glycosyltransferase family 39 protein [Nocardia alni]